MADLPFYALPEAVGIAGRTSFAKYVQRKHEELVARMNENGLLAAEHEKHYPPDWMRPAEVARTHPIFFVAMNGDLVFLKQNRFERGRWRYQQAWPGKWGLNLWRWRAYLRPPKAPQLIGEKVKGLVRGLLEKAGARGAKPVPQRSTARFSKRK